MPKNAFIKFAGFYVHIRRLYCLKAFLRVLRIFMDWFNIESVIELALSLVLLTEFNLFFNSIMNQDKKVLLLKFHFLGFR